MFRLLRNKKAQNTAEYAILIGLVVGAVITMQTYIKRGLQARIHDEVRDMAERTSDATIGLGNTFQYEPGYLESDFKITTGPKTSETLIGAAKNPTKTHFEEVEQAGKQTILNN